MVDFLSEGFDASPFEGLIPRPTKPVGETSLAFSGHDLVHSIDTAFKFNDRKRGVRYGSAC